MDVSIVPMRSPNGGWHAVMVAKNGRPMWRAVTTWPTRRQALIQAVRLWRMTRTAAITLE